MNSRRILAVVALAAAAVAQAAPFPVPGPAARKITAFDPGGHWPGAMHLKVDGTVHAVANPTVIAGSSPMAVTGVNDLVRLPARDAGGQDLVATVGAAGVRVLRAIPGGFDITDWPRPELRSGLQIRAAVAGPWIVVGVLCADARTVRFYRVTATGVVAGGSVVMPATVADFELTGETSGEASALVLTAGELRSVSYVGATRWTQAGGRGDLVAFPGHASARFGWIRKDGANRWEIALFGSSGLVDRSPVANQVGSAEVVVAACAADCTGDGVTDFVVKTTTRAVRMAGVAGAAMFAASPAVVVRDYSGVATTVPALVTIDGGTTWFLVDEHGGDGGATWTRLGAPPSLPLLALRDAQGRMTSGVLGDGVNARPATQVDFGVVLSPAAVARVATDLAANLETRLQITAWRVDNPASPTNRSCQANLLFRLTGSPDSNQLAPVSLLVDEQLREGFYWAQPVHYWFIARLCSVAPGTSTIVSVSESAPFATTAMTLTGGLDLSFLRSRRAAGVAEVPLENDLGGGVVGVITEFPVPPPAGGFGEVPPAVEPAGG